MISEKKYISIFPYNVKGYLNNNLFSIKKNKGIEATLFSKLKKDLRKLNIEINTLDIEIKEQTDLYVYFDLPFPANFSAWKSIIFGKAKKILICYEPPTVIPFNYMKPFHIFFKKVYTWNDQLVDNKKYFKINLPKSIEGYKTEPKKFENKKFLCLINSNKLPFFPFKIVKHFGKELYSERIKSIEFYEKFMPNKFFLYGRGWNKKKKYNLSEKIFGFKKYKCYKGEVKDKIKLLSTFKFCLCFENLGEVKGFITEKMFDCFKARCVPIYWGASNIDKYIPKKCYIDFRDFNDYKRLSDFLASIDESKYNGYIKNIESLLSDKKFKKRWFEEGFSEFFVKDVLEIN